MRTETFGTRIENMYGRDRKNVDTSDGKPAFMVNPSVIITLNDDMARELAAFLRKTSQETVIPPFIFAFMRRLEDDLQQV